MLAINAGLRYRLAHPTQTCHKLEASRRCRNGIRPLHRGHPAAGSDYLTMIFRCTQKLLKELRIKPQEPDVVSEVGSWHANLLRIDRRKCVLFTHDMTLFSVFIAGLKRDEFDHIDQVFGQAMFKTMRLFNFEQEEIERMLDWSEQNSYTKTANRSVLGSMNDIAFHIDCYIHDEGGLAYADLAQLHRRINQIPLKAIGYKYPRDCLKSLLSGKRRA